MERLEKALNDLYARNESWSSATCFASLVLSRVMSPKTIKAWFKKLVDKDDYAEEDMDEIIADLVNRRFVKTPKVDQK